ncbi:MAG: hydratase [Clostridiales bacterium]|jgi:aconitate hydratase|nr:hydratase [Clostridiales bacterium]
MVKYFPEGIYLKAGKLVTDRASLKSPPDPAAAREGTIAYQILRAHDKSDSPDKMRLKFDVLMSHDITYVSIIQTARASGMKKFPVPYVLTNCHNSLCAVGGTINEDDHAFGLSAAKKYGGIYVPANVAVCHQYIREELTACGRMILGSDSHTRYGCYGTMGIGEGGGELVKQLLDNTYDVDAPQVVLVWLEGAPPKGVGPQDVAISLCKEVFPEGLVKNKILEFNGPGVANLPMDYRIGIDVMTTETTCLSSIWVTDDRVKEYYENVGRSEDYKELRPSDLAYYDSYIKIDLSSQECMIALPFHPSNAYSIREFQADAENILKKVQDDCNKNPSLEGKAEMRLTDKIVDGRVMADQGIIVGCSGGMYDNLAEAAAILEGTPKNRPDSLPKNDYFSMSVYPSSAPIALAITKDGTAESLMRAGAIIKPAFCGPCFGAGDTPSNNALSIRHSTRNFPNREGSKPGEGQISAVALMDARSIAATALNGGIITAATEIEYDLPQREYVYDRSIYEKQIFNGFKNPQPETELRLGPNITDWPEFHALGKNILLKLAAVIHDEVTTTDELIPSGESSSFRSNPIRLAELTLSRRVPEYTARSKAIRQMDGLRRQGRTPEEILHVLSLAGADKAEAEDTSVASCVFARKPGDGSAREQAASCQRVLGGGANICYEYATKRYRSNLINWGIIPFTIDRDVPFDYDENTYIYVPDIRAAIEENRRDIPAKVISGDKAEDITLLLSPMTEEEKAILLEGCLINYYAAGNGANKF